MTEISATYWDGLGGSAFDGCTGLKALSISQDNEFFASANGAIYSKDRKKLIYYACLSNATHFSIPDGVTTIDTWAFNDCKSLTSIEIPSSVTTIGVGAFFNCTGLTSIKIPNSVTSISTSTFECCAGLTSIEIPSSVTSIGEDAFWGCNDNFVIITSADSYAEKYAKENEIKVKLI